MSEGAPLTGAPFPWMRVAVAGFLALLVFTIALMLATFPAGAYAVYSGKLSSNFTSATLVTPYFWVGPLVGFLPLHLPAGMLFAFLTAVYACLLVYLALSGGRPGSAVVKALQGGIGDLMSSPLFATVVAIGFLTFTASVIDAVVSSAGVPIGGISGDPLQVLLGLTNAPLVEELGFRLFLIGLVAYVLSLGKSLREALGALWRPSRALEGVAVFGGTSIILWAAVAFSSLTFGACHVACGGGAWQLGKLPEAIYGGVVLAVVYVKYGLPAAIITHWGVDYFGSAFAFYGQAAYSVPWNSATTEFVGQYLVDVDMLYLFGLACFLLVAYLGAKKLFASRGPEVDKPPPEGVPQLS